ncbi:MAG: TOBE domain-containing protein [Epsilonproteobacteria bacterium]|nr:TOBE domain-containing protein [Campylobacterota bacterium]
MELSSALTFEMLGKPFLLEKRIVLLHAIKEHGSISKAAKAVPMSYKSAWEAVDVMNSLSPEPIVSRETGGKDGGGTTITEYGETLLQNYALLKAEHTRFLERLSELTEIQSGTFKTIGRLAMQLSARNQIQAEVLSITSTSVHADIVLALKSGQSLHVVITQEAVENLQIEVGQSMTAIFKSNAVSLWQGEEENHLSGSIVELEKDETLCKIVIDMGNHDKIVAVLETSDTTLTLGSNIDVVVQKNHIILGK